MKNEDARKIVDAARAEAIKMQKAVTIIVVDAGGAPMFLERLDGSTGMHAMVADGKAAGSAFTGRDSVLNRTMAENNPAMVAVVSQRLAGRFVPVQGAVVLRKDGMVAGAVGVSGATAEEDEQIAKAGAAVVADGQSLS